MGDSERSRLALRGDLEISEESAQLLGQAIATLLEEPWDDVSVSLAAPAAHASDFGIYGACDSIDISETWNGAGARIAGRDCRDARTWKSNENALDRNHATQTQLIGFGGNLLTGLILNSQNQNREPQRSATSEAELAIMRQQQEIELLKLQLQMQQRQTANYGPYGAGINVQNVQPMPGYPQSPYGHAY